MRRESWNPLNPLMVWYGMVGGDRADPPRVGRSGRKSTKSLRKVEDTAQVQRGTVPTTVSTDSTVLGRILDAPS